MAKLINGTNMDSKPLAEAPLHMWAFMDGGAVGGVRIALQFGSRQLLLDAAEAAQMLSYAFGEKSERSPCTADLIVEAKRLAALRDVDPSA